MREPIDIEKVRAETPGTKHVTHFNNAGAALPPTVVIEAVNDYLAAENTLGGYEVAAERADDLNDVYEAAAEFLGGEVANWAFVESATRGWNAAFSALRFEPGDRVIATRAEYPSNMAGLLRAREIQGVEVVVAPNDEHGQLDIHALENLLDDRTRLVSVTQVPTQSGLVNPVAAVGAILRDTPILYQVDACQAVGQLPVHIDTLGCDVVSFTGRKFMRGPRATAMVWTSDAALAQMKNPAGVDGSGSRWTAPMTIEPVASARRFEPYEVFYAGKVGLAAALRYASSLGIERIRERNVMLSNRLRMALSELPGVTVQDQGILKAALVTFTIEGHKAAEIQHELRKQQINVSVSSVFSARLDFPDRGLTEVVRASVHYYNTTDEIDQLVAALKAFGN